MISYIIVGIFLPLFPFSMIFNAIHGRVHKPLLRILLLTLWPQIGLAIISVNSLEVTGGMLAWCLLTSMLYALRALALREVSLWTSFVGTSAWALLWVLLSYGETPHKLMLYCLGISVPLVLMTFLNAGLESRFGAAYLGLYGGLSQSIPRFTGILVLVVLAIVATPLFPTFFAMLNMILKAIPAAPSVAMGVAIIWLLWSWAGARLLQGLIVGPVMKSTSDLSQTSLYLYIAALVGLLVAGVYWSGSMV